MGIRKFLVLILIAAAVLALALSCTRALTEKEAAASLRRTVIQYGSYTKTGCSYEFRSLEVESGVLAYARVSECGERGHYEYSYRVSLAELEPSGVSVKVDMEGTPRLYAPCIPDANCVEITERYRDQRGEGTKQYSHRLVMLGFTGEIPERELESLGETFTRLLEFHAPR